MITYEQFWTKVREAAEAELGHAVDDEYTSAFSRAALKVLDLHVANNGEIVDPRPAPAPPSYPKAGAPYSKFSRGRRK